MWSSISALPKRMPVREPGSRCGALVMLSMPPATTTSAEPARSRSWPSITAFMPEPQTLLMVVQPVATGMPAAMAAWRAGAWPRPAGSTQPMITSDTASAGRPDCSTAALMAVAPKVVAGTPVNWPSNAPSAVRLAPTITTSLIAFLATGKPELSHFGVLLAVAVRTSVVGFRFGGRGPGGPAAGGVARGTP